MNWITNHKTSTSQQTWNVQRDVRIGQFLRDSKNLVSPPTSPQTPKTYQFISENFTKEQKPLKRCSSLEKIKISSLCNDN